MNKAKVNAIVFKTGKIAGWILMVIILLYLVSGFAMTGKFGFDKILNEHLAWEIHEELFAPLVIAIFFHVFPRFYLRRKK